MGILMVTFSEVVKVRRTACKKCLSLIYDLPCKVDEKITSFLKSFGDPVYPLSTIRLLKIHSKDGYKINGKLGRKSIKLDLPKKLEHKDLNKESRKPEFEFYLKEWMSEKLDITIE